MISSPTSSDGNPSKPADEFLPDEQTPLLIPTPHQTGPTPGKSLPRDSKDADEESVHVSNNSDNQPKAKPDTSIVGVISVLLLGNHLSPIKETFRC